MSANENEIERPECCGVLMYKHAKTPTGRTRWRCRLCGSTTTASEYSEQFHYGYDRDKAFANVERIRQAIKAGQTKFVITSAQNNTRATSKGLKSLKTYCEYNGAELMMIPVHYKNISLYSSPKEYKKYWNKELEEYIVDEQIDLGGNVTVMADIRIGATSLWPLRGKQPIGGNKWTIFGHPQHSMEPVAAPPHRLPKRMYTTGSVTLKNYSKTDLGAKAAFHHVTGALVVEVVGKVAFIRTLNIDSKGCFYDLDKYYTPDKVKVNQSILALVPGDEHVKHIKKNVVSVRYTSKDSIVNKLRPEKIIRHDVLDCYFGSHWHEKDDVLQFRKYHKGDHSGRSELDQVVKFINDTTPDYAETLIVASNHHEHLYRYLSRVDFRKDHENALLILELKKQQYENAIKGKTTDPFEIYLSGRLTCKYKFLRRQSSYYVKKVDVSHHGDEGPNGSRGSAVSFAKLGDKYFIGHGHGARICKGTHQVGKSTGQQEYEGGLSDHTNTDGIIYKNGKKALIDIFGDKFHG